MLESATTLLKSVKDVMSVVNTLITMESLLKEMKTDDNVEGMFPSLA